MALKRVAYYQGKCFVEYEIINGYICVFSGITSGGRTTINAAEEIIKAISEKESHMPMKFYDLQTSKGYAHYAPGEYDFNLLVFSGSQNNPDVVRWIPEFLSGRILEMFKEYIGPNPRRKSN